MWTAIVNALAAILPPLLALFRRAPAEHAADKVIVTQGSMADAEARGPHSADDVDKRLSGGTF